MICRQPGSSEQNPFVTYKNWNSTKYHKIVQIFTLLHLLDNCATDNLT